MFITEIKFALIQQVYVVKFGIELTNAVFGFVLFPGVGNIFALVQADGRSRIAHGKTDAHSITAII